MKLNFAPIINISLRVKRVPMYIRYHIIAFHPGYIWFSNHNSCLLIWILPKSNSYPITRLQNNLSLHTRMTSINLMHKALHLFKPLQQPHDCVSHFCQSKLLANTYSWTAIEWYVGPRLWLPGIPTFGREYIWIFEGSWSRWVHVWTSLHQERRIPNRRILEDTNWLWAVWATTTR